jgi:16S rRNA processing protein RimM
LLKKVPLNEGAFFIRERLKSRTRLSTSTNSGARFMSSYVKVGRVKDAHGIKGELFIKLFAGEAAWLEKLETIRLVPEAGDQPEKTLKVKSARVHKKGLIAKTEEIRDRNEAETLKGWIFEIPSDFLVSEKGDTIYLREIQGFKVFTKDRGEIGSVEDFGTNGAQDLLLVRTPSGDYEIPFVEAFVESIDYGKGEIRLDVPPGLLGDLDEEASGDESQ